MATQNEHQKLIFITDYRLMQVKSIAECSKGSILQYFQPSLKYYFALRPLFCLFLSGALRQVLLLIHFGSAGQGLMSLAEESRLARLQLRRPFIMLGLGSIVMDSVISELCYKGTLFTKELFENDHLMVISLLFLCKFP